ncbi:MAG TPA: sensor histidine kinase, partial [Clostridia bacterium]|nr:sensor histidine kinase [Clostridia bacterium]
LAENAIRYNGQGVTITVGLALEPERIVIAFEDNGTGIPASLAQDIFKPFVRSADARGARPGGAGLGLSIAQKIVLAHGGTIGLRAKDGPGCAFIIALPRI